MLSDMARKKLPTQTTPKGTEIPVPKREEFYGNLDKMVNASTQPTRTGGNNSSG
jgi:hypothetical protein